MLKNYYVIGIFYFCFLIIFYVFKWLCSDPTEEDEIKNLESLKKGITLYLDPIYHKKYDTEIVEEGGYY